MGRRIYLTVSGEDVTEACGACQGRGVLEVCGVCGGQPDILTDACACSVEVLWAMEHTDWMDEAA
jgi:DnaJ-class molecular chaperone